MTLLAFVVENDFINIVKRIFRKMVLLTGALRAIVKESITKKFVLKI